MVDPIAFRYWCAQMRLTIHAGDHWRDWFRAVARTPGRVYSTGWTHARS